MPWKNGGGSTTELMVEPPGATLQTGFLWRLSMAGLPASGPFSRFEGYDRTLVLLEGRGLRVDHGSHGSALLTGPLEACVFPGEWDTTGELLDGPCRDFNVMTARAAFAHQVQVLRPDPNGCLLPDAPVVLVYCVSGRIQVPELGERMEAGELLRLEGAGPLTVVAEAPGAALIVAALTPGGEVFRPWPSAHPAL